MGCTCSKQPAADQAAVYVKPNKPSDRVAAVGAATSMSTDGAMQGGKLLVGKQQEQQEQQVPHQQARAVDATSAATPAINGAATPALNGPAPSLASSRQASEALHDSASSARHAFTDFAKAQASEQHITVDEFIANNTSSTGSFYGSTAASSAPASSTTHIQAYKATSPPAAMLPYTPHDTAAHGAPKPACHAERDATATAIARMRDTKDGELEAVLGALCRAFNTDTAAVSLLTGDIISHIAACGIPHASPPVCPQSIGFCGWSFINTNHELLVIEDMKQDSRTADNVVVLDPSYDLSFYVGAPLITSDGHRLGTLCMTSQKPQSFDADRASFLANMTEVVVRQLESSWARQLAERKEGRHLARSLACYDMAYMLVDASQPNWRVIYMNRASQEQLGIPWTFSSGDLPALKDDIKHALKLEGVPLEDYFNAQHSTLEWAKKGCEFTVEGVEGAAGTPMEGRNFKLTFKLASADGLDDKQPVQFGIGVPPHLPAASDGFGRSLFFVQLSSTATAASTAAPSCRISIGSASSVEGSVRSWTAALTSKQLNIDSIVPRGVGADACPVEGLVLGPLLGRGGYGRVYRGVYKGTPVAVKMIEDISTLRTTASGEPLEAVLTQGISHLGVMRTITYAFASNRTACWMLFEYCDRANIQDGVIKGWFRTTCSLKRGGVNLRTVALTAYEVASAMAFLHKHDIVHGDLKGGNVMLSTSTVNPHGFTAKVGDFGLARKNGPALPKNVYGTVTHMPPEVLLEGGMTKATDVYSFGVMLWEMLTTSKAWAGMRHTEIICQVAILKRQLAVPKGLPPALERLLQRCLAPDVSARCTFQEALEVLTAFLQATQHKDMSSVVLESGSKDKGGDDVMSL